MRKNQKKLRSWKSTTSKKGRGNYKPLCSSSRQHYQRPTTSQVRQRPTQAISTDKTKTFKDLFKVNIHDHPKLKPVQKFQYLKGALSGEAAELVHNLLVTDANYPIAWQLLQDRFEDKKFITTSILQQLFGQQALTSESASDLCKFLDTTKRCLRSLEQLTPDGENWKAQLLDASLLHLLTPKLDSRTRREWEFSALKIASPTMDVFYQFVQDRVSVLRNLPASVSPTSISSKRLKLDDDSRASRINQVSRNTFYKPCKCPCCSSADHRLYKCAQFLAMTTTDRRQFVSAKQLCFNCFSPDHRSVQCTSSSCRKCDQKHHTTLHQDPPASTQVIAATLTSAPRQVLLGTAVIFVEDVKGNLQRVRALIDNCAQKNIMSQACARRLGLPTTATATSLSGINETSVGVSTGVLKFNIRSCMDPSYCTEVKASVLPKVTPKLPQQRVTSGLWPHLSGLSLADPTYHQPGEVDLLLGVVHYNQIVQSQRRDGPPGTPTAMETKFGWILSGEAPVQFDHDCDLTLCTLDSELKRFWEIEEPATEKYLSNDQRAAEDIFTSTTTRTTDGRFVVNLPFKNSPPILGESRQAAYRRLISVERQLAKSDDKRNQYEAFMKEYLSLGHMVPVKPDSAPAYFLPHHAVIKQDSSTTKLRVVFDASAASTNGRSLNSELYTGPNIQDDIFDLVARLRTHRIVFIADVEKMFRHIVLDPAHRRYQRILYRFNPSDPVQEFELTTVTYGTSSAPFLATRCLKQLAEEEVHRYPSAAPVLLHDVYMDDVLSGSTSEECAEEVVSQLQQLLKAGGFSLRKWSSNSSKLLATIPEELHEKSASLAFEEDPKAKTLGIRWTPKSDDFFFTVASPTAVSTKRELLSDVAKVYDPLGWLAPVTVNAKILLQQLWLQQLSWDQHLPKGVLVKWESYRQDLMNVEDIKINRQLSPFPAHRLELHGFCDASESAYAAAIYLRSIGESITTNLVAAKTKVAPLKTISLPKLELSGANLLCLLMEAVKKALKLEFEDIHYWSDSTIVLAWIQCQPSTLKCFVANRVSNIQQLSSPASWSHIEGVSNPADCASRGINAKDLLTHSLWWNGPSFLNSADFVVPAPVQVPEVLPERREPKVFTTLAEDFNLLSNYSSLGKLQRVTAHILRFRSNALARQRNETRRQGPSTIQELRNAQAVLVRLTQALHFSQDLKALQDGDEIPRNSILRTLSVILDQQGIIRVGGRIRRSKFSFDFKHPILLPKSSPLTTLVIRQYHLDNLHAGNQLTEATIRQRFWIVGATDAIRAFIHRCVTCYKRRAEVIQVKMGDLPYARVNISSPFHHTGVDYAGPFLIKSKIGRGATTTKGYICLMICMATRAIHLELVSSLTTTAFIVAFKRFSSVRGKPDSMFSDNGTNFQGADRELREFLQSKYYKLHFPADLAQDEIGWNFNPPGAPHMGGLWEAGVKSVKTHLKSIMSDASLTYEEFLTCLKQVEACVNSRPISPISSSPDDFLPLTPGHFLIGRPLTALPERDFTEVKWNRLARWERVQQLVQHFWSRWSSEYLSRLQQRPKWWKNGPNLKPGDLVLLKERTAQCRWKLARILDIHPGDDGVVRVVTVKTATSEFQRPVTAISPLPVNDSE